MPLKKLVLFFPCLIIFVSVYSQKHSQRFQHITINDGLSQSYVNAIIQDKYGYIWFGTHDGLNRYDGYSFKYYKTEAQNPKSLQDFIIRCLYYDQSNNLWIGGYNLSLYNPDEDNFIQFPNNINSSNTSIKFITRICEDPQGNLWLIYPHSGVSFFDVKKHTFFNLPLKSNKSEGLSTDNVNDIFIDKTNMLWIGTLEGYVEKLDLTEFYKSGHLKLEKINLFRKNTLIYPIYQDHEGYLWFSSSGDKSLIIYNIKEKKFINAEEIYKGLHYFTQNAISANFIYQDFNGIFWITTQTHGVFRYDPFNNLLENYKHIAEDPTSMISNYITSIFEDQFGVIWFGTDRGISRLNLFGKKFHHYQYKPNNPNSLPDNLVNSIYEDENNILWAGISNFGLTKINLKTDSFKTYLESAALPHILLGNNIFSITGIKNNYLLTTGVNLNILNFTNNHFSYCNPVLTDPHSLCSWGIWKIHKGKKSGNYWIGTQNGLNKLVLSDHDLPETKGPTSMTSMFSQYKHDLNNNNSLISNNIWDVYEDGEGIVWIGTNGGLSIYNPFTDVFTNYKADMIDSNSLSNPTINCIFEDKSGRIWIGTEGGGLNEFIKKKKIFAHYREKDGLASDVVWGILEDGLDNLWISTSHGFSKFNPSQKSFKNYDVTDGLQSNEFTRGAYFKNKNGRMYFGGINGINAFYPNEIKDNPFSPKVVISGLYIFNQPVKIGLKYNDEIILSKPVSDVKNLTLSYKNNVITLEFSALHYASPKKNQYAYMLEGFDNDWIYTGSDKRLVHYMNLPAGTYKFWLKASNCDGVWTRAEDPILTIHILPPFWNTWWFRILTGLSIILIIVGSAYIRIYQIEKQKVKLQKMVDEQTTELRMQSEVMREVNVLLKENQEELKKQKFVLQEINVLLEERQEEIMAQKEEIQIQAEVLREQTEELKELNATKDKFFTIIGHDLKNPFHAINGLSNYITENYIKMDDAQKIEIIGMIKESSAGAATLLENLLLWSRSQSNNILFAPEKLDMSEVVESTLLFLKIIAEKKQIKIINKIKTGSFIFADRNMINTVVRNLISNAIKFTPAEGTVTVLCKELENKMEINVTDTGQGIEEVILQKLFRINSHVSTPGTMGESGTGLGLILCKEFIEKNEGKIWVESELNKGSSFKFTLKKA